MKINFALIKKLLLKNEIEFSANLIESDILGEISAINKADKDSLIFLFDEKYLDLLNKTKAKCCIFKKRFYKLSATKY